MHPKLVEYGRFAVKWFITTCTLIGVAALWVWFRVNIQGESVKFAMPEYPQKIEYGYTDSSDERPSKRK